MTQLQVVVQMSTVHFTAICAHFGRGENHIFYPRITLSQEFGV